MANTSTKFTQIAFSFDDFGAAEEAINHEVQEPVAKPMSEEPPVNVGVRLKALKTVVPVQETVETVEEETPVALPEVIEVSAIEATELESIVAKPVINSTNNNSALRTKSTRGRKSLKAIAAEADLINIPDDEVLFQKQYYPIGEVAEMFHVNTSLIRFWTNEFDMIQPRTNRKGDRLFRPVDIKNLQLIHDLLRRRKLTIEGAKDFLKKNKKAQERHEMIESLRKMKSFFLEVKASL
ncbi:MULTISPECIES: MerR family transcriptional regulator [unclassified Paraflavitalea]|uniref:MerR family transcriptional regulator n=1 Tax=unclassified Paraflavitalea TaxID=2798305 RepID=UPI003D33CD36